MIKHLNVLRLVDEEYENYKREDIFIMFSQSYNTFTSLEQVSDLENGAHFIVDSEIKYPRSKIKRWRDDQKKKGFIYKQVRSRKKVTHYVLNEIPNIEVEWIYLSKKPLSEPEYVNIEGSGSNVIEKTMFTVLSDKDVNESGKILKKLDHNEKVFKVCNVKKINGVNVSTYNYDIISIQIEDILQTNKESKHHIKLMHKNDFLKIIGPKNAMTKDDYINLHLMCENNNIELAITLMSEYNLEKSVYWLAKLKFVHSNKLLNNKVLNLANNKMVKDRLLTCRSIRDFEGTLSYLDHPHCNIEWINDIENNCKKIIESNINYNLKSYLTDKAQSYLDIDISISLKPSSKVPKKYYFR